MTKRKQYASGGVIHGASGSPTSDEVSFVLSRGGAVVPDSMLAKYGREHLEALNGGHTDVVSASEALAAMDDDD